MQTTLFQKLQFSQIRALSKKKNSLSSLQKIRLPEFTLLSAARKISRLPEMLPVSFSLLPMSFLLLPESAGVPGQAAVGWAEALRPALCLLGPAV